MTTCENCKRLETENEKLRERVEHLRRDLNESIREEQRAARDSYAEGQWAERERAEQERGW